MAAILQTFFKCIFSNKNVWISIKISMKFIPEVPINIIPALVQIMAWCRRFFRRQAIIWTMMVSLPTNIRVTRPQWVNGAGLLCFFSVFTYDWYLYFSHYMTSFKMADEISRIRTAIACANCKNQNGYCVPSNYGNKDMGRFWYCMDSDQRAMICTPV